jgi:hypothetical protein
MPGIIDDIIIKKAVLRGMFKAAEHQGLEVEKHGLLADCKDLDDELRAAYVPFRDTLQKVIDEMEARVTRKVCP